LLAKCLSFTFFSAVLQSIFVYNRTSHSITLKICFFGPSKFLVVFKSCTFWLRWNLHSNWLTNSLETIWWRPLRNLSCEWFEEYFEFVIVLWSLENILAWRLVKGPLGWSKHEVYDLIFFQYNERFSCFWKSKCFESYAMKPTLINRHILGWRLVTVK